MNAKERACLRATIFASMIVLFVVAVILIMMYSPYQFVASALLGAIPITIYAFYDRFLIVPDLEISYDPKNKDLHKPTLTGIPSGRVWHYLRLRVKNEGFSVAKNCIAELRVINRPQKDGSECPAPAREP